MHRPRRSRWQLSNRDGIRLPPARYATLLLFLGIAGYGAFAIGGTVLRTTGAPAALLVTVVILVVGLQVVISRPDRGPREPVAYLALAIQAVLVIGPLVQFGAVWQGFSGFLSASALLVLPRTLGVLAFFGVLAAVVPATLTGPLTFTYGAPYAVIYAITSTITGTIAVYGLSTLARLVVQAHDARSELQRVAVARERVRIARDVHDLLGESLSTIVLRCELVVRLIEDFPERARTELGAIVGVARKAGDDVRRVSQVSQDLTSGKAPPVVPPSASTMAPRLAGSLLATAGLAFLATAVPRAAVERGPLVAVLVAALGLVFVLLVSRLVTRSDTAVERRSRVLVLATLSAIVFLPLPYLGQFWHGLPAYLAGVILAVVPGAVGRLGWLAVLALVMTAEFLDPGPGEQGYGLFYLAAGSVVISLVVYGLATLPRLVDEVNAAQADLSRLAVAQERLRVARDVHDLLGLSLSTIVVKCELIAKLLEADPNRARAELDDVRVAARRAVDDVRTVLAGNGRLSLPEECRLAEETLLAASIRVQVHCMGGLPGQPADSVLATVMREGVTNVLRHSTATWCEISLRRSAHSVELDIVNDGVGDIGVEGASLDGARGSGLANLLHRVEVVGGELTAQRDGRLHRLRATVPRSVPGGRSGSRRAVVTAGSRLATPRGRPAE